MRHSAKATSADRRPLIFLNTFEEAINLSLRIIVVILHKPCFGVKNLVIIQDSVYTVQRIERYSNKAQLSLDQRRTSKHSLPNLLDDILPIMSTH
jgi:hypothetical protein